MEYSKINGNYLCVKTDDCFNSIYNYSLINCYGLYALTCIYNTE